MIRNNSARFFAIFLFIFVTGCSKQKPMTVVQVIQDAESLDGQVIHVRGVAVLQTNPSREEMLVRGGCVPGSTEGQVTGWLTLYDPSTQNPNKFGSGTGIKIAESSFHCEGNYCKITCSPLKVTTHEMYEFAGTFRVIGDAEFLLEDIDAEQSRQFVGGEWVAISSEPMDVTFP